MLSRIALFAVATLAMAATISPHAALAADTTVDFTSMLEPVVTAVVGVAGAAVLWLARSAINAFQDRTDIELDQNLVDKLNMALFHAIKFGEGKAVEAMRDRTVRVDFKNELVANAVRYATSKVPDTLEYFGIDEDGLADMIEARLDIDINGDGFIGGRPSQEPSTGQGIIAGGGLGTAA